MKKINEEAYEQIQVQIPISTYSRMYRLEKLIIRT